MNNIFAATIHIDFLTWLWLFTIAFALHELEEWNILNWYQRNYVDLPPSQTWRFGYGSSSLSSLALSGVLWLPYQVTQF